MGQKSVMSHGSSAAHGTRERLLEAAGEVFAEKGFRKATVREIVRRAGASLNAVNYHFRDKEGLYQEVIAYAHRWYEEVEDGRLEADEELPAEERLRAFVSAFMKRQLDHGRVGWRPRLIGNEIAEPTGALDMVVERFIRPRFNLLVGIVRELAGNDTPLDRAQLCAQSIVSQCVHFHRGRPIIIRLMPHLTYSRQDMDALAEHITQFCLRAIRNLGCDDGCQPTGPEK